ncbi:MAG: phosphate ABC transporter permease subunit PstC [Microthrixaceae bacterium]|nr:phosphate ABC transporter permease subunit PstC [Mycobacterium sp.]MCB0986795.1 phosphate ABC transporter permease subunit PstC [Acidimicrobiales bacterium]MCB9402822.1 phosphate ABC transporter permease subunit PstC [Microthrixaceae bacterium]
MEPHSPTGLRLEDLAGSPTRNRTERLVHLALTGAAATSVLISVAIVAVLFRDAMGFVTSIRLGDLGDEIWNPRLGRFGVMSPILGTLWVTLVAVLVAGPIGLGAAIYLSEYAKPRVRRSVKPVVEVLASIPSVVVGYFAIRFIAPELVQRIFPGAPAKNLLVAGIAVGLLTIPLMTSVAEDALRAVPLNLREASYGLGAKKVTTVIRVVVPAAVSGLVAGLILSISRAIGETMVVFLAAGGVPTRPTSPLDGGTTVTAAMAAVATGTDNVAGASNTFQSAFFLGLILFAFTLTLNLVADRFVRRVRQKY